MSTHKWSVIRDNKTHSVFWMNEGSFIFLTTSIILLSSFPLIQTGRHEKVSNELTYGEKEQRPNLPLSLLINFTKVATLARHELWKGSKSSKPWNRVVAFLSIYLPEPFSFPNPWRDPTPAWKYKNTYFVAEHLWLVLERSGGQSLDKGRGLTVSDGDEDCMKEELWWCLWWWVQEFMIVFWTFGAPVSIH